MLIDLLSTDQYVSYNIHLAHIIGLHASIYISELININKKAIDKKKIEDDFFLVNRPYIEKRTTLKEKEQREIEEVLEKINIICRKNDRIKLNTEILTSLILEKNEKIVADISKNIKKTKLTKAEIITKTLTSYINTDNEELRTAYCNWIDAVMSRQGWMSKESVIEGQKAVDQYTNYNLDIALKILSIAAINGWRDLKWAITSFNKDYGNKFIKSQKPLQTNNTPELSEEIF